MDVDEYQELRARADELQSTISRAEGALEQQMQQLADEFDCDSLAAAKKLLRRLEREEQKSESEYEEARAAFVEEFGDELGIG